MLHQRRPSPDNSWVGSCIISFVACSAFTRVTTCRLAKSPYATLYTGGSGGFVASTAAPIATGWSDPVPGRVYLPLWTNAFHGAPLSPGYINHRRTAKDEAAFFPVIAASRTPPWLVSGWGCRGRRLSRAGGNLCRWSWFWRCHQIGRA